MTTTVLTPCVKNLLERHHAEADGKSYNCARDVRQMLELRDLAIRMEAALTAIRSEIDGMADADIDGPNVFMRIDTLIDGALG